MLLLITAYGRCLADQMGALQNSGAACCQTTQPSCCDTHDSETTSHDDESNHEENDEGTPCPLCLILSSDSLLLQESLEIPSLSPYCINILWDDLFIKEPRFNKIPQLDLAISITGNHDPSQTHLVQQQRITAKFHPVRGPSLIIS